VYAYRFRMFEIRVLRKIFGTQGEIKKEKV
jgi:hypothetical protein